MPTPGDLFHWRAVIMESDLPPLTRHVALTLSTFMDSDGTNAYPALKTLAAATGLHLTTVCAHLNALESAGLLKRHRSKGGRGVSTRYEARFEETVAPARWFEAETVAGGR